MDLIIQYSSFICYILARVRLYHVWCTSVSLFACLFVCFFQLINIDQDKHWWVLRKILVPPNNKSPVYLTYLSVLLAVTILLLFTWSDLSKHCLGLGLPCPVTARDILYQKDRRGERRLRPGTGPDVLIVRHSCNPTPLSRDTKRAPLWSMICHLRSWSWTPQCHQSVFLVLKMKISWC